MSMCQVLEHEVVTVEDSSEDSETNRMILAEEPLIRTLSIRRNKKGKLTEILISSPFYALKHPVYTLFSGTKSNKIPAQNSTQPNSNTTKSTITFSLFSPDSQELTAMPRSDNHLINVLIISLCFCSMTKRLLLKISNYCHRIRVG